MLYSQKNTFRPYIENCQTSGITIIDGKTVQKMAPHTFQEKLHSHHVIVTDHQLSQISCDHHGLLSLNGSKEIVDMEGIIINFTH